MIIALAENPKKSFELSESDISQKLMDKLLRTILVENLVWILDIVMWKKMKCPKIIDDNNIITSLDIYFLYKKKENRKGESDKKTKILH